jgi:hypothetical protein
MVDEPGRRKGQAVAGSDVAECPVAVGGAGAGPQAILDCGRVFGATGEDVRLVEEGWAFATHFLLRGLTVVSWRRARTLISIPQE